MRRFLAEIVFLAFDMRWPVEEQIAEGEQVLARFIWRGTDRDPSRASPQANGNSGVRHRA